MQHTAFVCRLYATGSNVNRESRKHAHVPMIWCGAQRFAVAALVVLVTLLPGTSPHRINVRYTRCRLSLPQVAAKIRLCRILCWALRCPAGSTSNSSNFSSSDRQPHHEHHMCSPELDVIV